MARPTNKDIEEAEALHQQGLRLCSQCEAVKPVSEYGAYSRGRHGLQKRCKPCINEQNRTYAKRASPEAKARKAERTKEHRRQHPEYWKKKSQDSNARRYGFVDYESYQNFLDRPCEICGEETATHVDHCHETGRIRGALCYLCNPGLGHFKDDPDRLDAARKYVLQFRS